MKIAELDVIKLKDGKIGTVLETYESGCVFLVEFSNENGVAEDIRIVKIEEIEMVIWSV